MSKSKFDGITLGSIEKRIEDGMMFEVSSRLSIANSGGVGKWLFRTGHKQVVVVDRQITSNGDELTYQAFKSPTVTSDGTPVTPVNRNSASKIDVGVKVFSSPTTTASGLAIPAVYMPGSAGIGQRTSGQFERDGRVRVLEAYTDYLITITNDGSENPATTEIYLLWGEVSDPAPFQE